MSTRRNIQRKTEQERNTEQAMESSANASAPRVDVDPSVGFGVFTLAGKRSPQTKRGSGASQPPLWSIVEAWLAQDAVGG